MGGVECAAVWRAEYHFCFLTSGWGPVVHGVRVQGNGIMGLKINYWTVSKQVHVLVLLGVEALVVAVLGGKVLDVEVLITEVLIDLWVEFWGIRTHHGVLEKEMEMLIL